MKKRFLLTLFLMLILVANISLATYNTVTMSVVEEPVCTITIGDNSKFEKKLISKDLSNKEVTLQLQVTNEDAASQPTGELMLVIDNSKSMEDTVSVDGTSKTREDLVINSAKTLVNSILKDNKNLKIGAVSFSTNSDVSKEGTTEDAALVSELSSDVAALDNAISNIQYTGPRTDLDAGLKLASKHFSSESNNKYMIILTDGVPNVAVDYDKNYYSDDVITKTKTQLQSLKTTGYNVITMLTGISNPTSQPGMGAGTKTYDAIIKEVFGTQDAPTVGKFYYVQDSEIEKTITQDIYKDLLPVSKTLKNITVTDYFPKEIVNNFEFAYVSKANIGDISAEINTENNSITWTIPELKSGETATVQYKLKLKQNFDSNIVGKILKTNEKVDLTYNDFDGNKQEKTTDITPKLKLVEPPAQLPKAGLNTFVVSILVVVALAAFFFVRFKKLNDDIK